MNTPFPAEPTLSPPSPLQLINQRLPLQQRLHVPAQNPQTPPPLTPTLPRDMRRNKAIPRGPQPAPRRQRLGVRDIDGRAPNPAVLERINQRVLVDDRAAGDIHHKGATSAPSAENVKLLAAQQLCRRWGERQRDHEEIEVLREEGVEVTVVPGGGQRAVWVAEVGEVEGGVVAGAGVGRGLEVKAWMVMPSAVQRRATWRPMAP